MAKKKFGNQAVSEVIGTILLLGISVTLFSIVYASFFAVDLGSSSPDVELVGSIENNNLTIEHLGGESLDLDTKIQLRLSDGSNVVFSADDDEGNGIEDENDYLPASYKSDGKWNIGEMFKLPLGDVTNFARYDPINLSIIDEESNSMIMWGTLKESEQPGLVDLNLTTTIDINVDVYPPIISFTTNLTHDGDGKGGIGETAFGVIVQDEIPEGLTYSGHIETNGKYTPPSGGVGSGEWYIDSIGYGDTFSLTVKTTIEVMGGESLYTDLFFLIDGSSSISQQVFEDVLSGIAGLLRDGTIKHDGSVTISVLQLAIPKEGGPQYMDVPEVGPVNVEDELPMGVTHYQSIANQIENIQKLTFNPTLTPISKGFDIAKNEIEDTGHHQDLDCRQIINLITDGKASFKFTGIPPMTDFENDCAKDMTEIRRNELVVELTLDYESDSINVFEMDGQYGINHDWLNDNIVFPAGYPYNGFITKITDDVNTVNTTKLNEAIETSLEGDIGERIYEAYISQSSVGDPNLENNHSEITYDP